MPSSATASRPRRRDPRPGASSAAEATPSLPRTPAWTAATGSNAIALRQPPRVLAERRLRRGDLMSVGELAMLAHLPADPAVPGLARATARSVAPAPWLRSVGKVLGDADAGPPRPVAITAADARHHLHVVGATGVGKTTLIASMVLDDVAQRRGVVVVDPSGDLVNDLLDRLPAEVGERLVLLDPSEDQAPPILNMLDGPDPDLAVDHVVGRSE